MRIHLLALLLAIPALVAGDREPRPPLPFRPAVRTLATEVGLPMLAVNGLVQSPTGDLWAGTQQGLATYAGGRFHPVPNPPDQPNLMAGTLLPTAQGLWVGSLAGGLFLKTPQGWKSWRTVEGVPLGRVSQCVEAPQGRLLILSVGRPVMRVEGDRLLVQEGMPTVPVTRLLWGPEGWLAATREGLLCQRAGTWSRVPGIEGPVMGLARSGERILACTPTALHLLEGGTWKRIPAPSGGTLHSVCVGPGLSGSEAFWAINTSHLFCLEAGALQEVLLTPHEKPPQLTQVSCTSDGGGRQIWISSLHGLFRIQPGGWNRLDADTGPGTTITFAMARAHDGSLWFGDSHGRFHQLKGDHWRTLTPVPPEQAPMVSALCPLPGREGPMLAWIQPSGLWHWDGSRWTHLGLGNLKPATVIPALVPGLWQGQEGVWVVCEQGLAFARPGQAPALVAPYGRPLRWALPDPIHPGRVYTGGLCDEILVMEDGTLRSLIPLKDAGMSTVATWVPGEEGRTLRVGTMTQGLFTFGVEGGLRAQHTRDLTPGWPGASIMSLATDLRGRTWVGTDAGLAVLSRDGRLLATYTHQDGLPSDLCTNPALFPEGDLRMWTGTSRGVAFLPMPSLAPRALPSLRLTGLHSERGPFLAGIRLAHPARQIRIAFDLPLLHRESDLRYRAVMAGVDVSRAPWTPDTHIVFPTLPAGHYRMQVWAMDGQGHQTGPLEIPFSVAPPLWRHPGVMGLYLLLVGAAALALHRLRMAHLRAHNRELSEAIARATHDLRATNDRLYQLNDEKNRIIGVAAHDLRNPLNGILLSCDLMEADLPDPLIGDLTNIRGLSRGMNALIQELLDVNAIEANTAETPVLAPTDPMPLLREVHRTYAGRAQAKGLALHLEPGPEGPPGLVLADARHLQRVLDNLVSNAVKYSPPGLEVHLRLIPGPASLRFEVQDHGPGLTEADKARVFGAYARLSARPTGGESSVGLGLSIVKKLVVAMGGRLGVDSVAGQGATFWVNLPRATGVPPLKPEQ